MKKTNKKGFTLAELLVVVAIIAVLVAIAIPIFTSQLEKSREATDMANIRSAYAEVTSAYLTDNKTNHSVDVKLTQTKKDWQSEGTIAGVKLGDGTNGTLGATANGTITVTITTEGEVTIGGIEVKGDTVRS